jgi:hypothetical protein
VRKSATCLLSTCNGTLTVVGNWWVFSLLWALVISTMPESIKVSIYWINPNSIIHIYIYIYIYIYSNFQKHLFSKNKMSSDLCTRHVTRQMPGVTRSKACAPGQLLSEKYTNTIRKKNSEAQKLNNIRTDYTQPTTHNRQASPTPPSPAKLPPLPPKFPKFLCIKKIAVGLTNQLSAFKLYVMLFLWLVNGFWLWTAPRLQCWHFETKGV